MLCEIITLSRFILYYIPGIIYEPSGCLFDIQHLYVLVVLDDMQSK